MMNSFYQQLLVNNEQDKAMTSFYQQLFGTIVNLKIDKSEVFTGVRRRKQTTI